MKRLLFALTLALAAGALVGVAGPADAADAWTAGLTASNASSGITFATGRVLTPQGCATTCEVREAQWSYDGGQAVYVDADSSIRTVRNEDGSVLPLVAASTTMARQHPIFYRVGESTRHPETIIDGIIWAEKPIDGSQPSRLMIGPDAYGHPARPFSPDDGRAYAYPNPGPFGQVVYEVYDSPSGTPSVGLYHPSADEKFRTVIADARQPAFNGTQIAFVRSDGTHDQIWTVWDDGSALAQLTFDAVDHSNPVWTPALNTVAFGAGGKIGAVDLSGGVVGSADIAGVPAYVTSDTDAALRLAGTDRYATATIVSQSYWATAGAADFRTPAKAVVLARSDTFADSLGGAALATAKGGPLLLTASTSLPSRTATEIERVLGTTVGAKVYILGGSGAVSSTVEAQVTALGYTVVRLGGADRFETAVKIADAISPTPATILVATGQNFPDALAAGAAAGSRNRAGEPDPAVVMLSNDTTLTPAVTAYLGAHPSATVIPIGGQAAAATQGLPNAAPGLVGSDRYQTAVLVAATFFGGAYFTGVATGDNWPDALAGGALMGTLNVPVVLTSGLAANLSPPTAAYLASRSGFIGRAVLFGGTGVLTTAQHQQVCHKIATPSVCYLQGPTGYIAPVG